VGDVWPRYRGSQHPLPTSPVEGGGAVGGCGGMGLHPTFLDSAARFPYTHAIHQALLLKADRDPSRV
jgi:hypothetical protein